MLRQGLPLEAALSRAAEGIERADDRSLVHAIAAETLRRLTDLDALIDSATPKPLPHDAKARTVLRIALVQALVLGTPPHAAIATVLPLVDGGPKRLVHGVFGTLMRRGAELPDLPALPQQVAKRWRKAWGKPTVDAARALLATTSVIDLTLRDPAATAEWAERLDGVSLAPGHVRLARSVRIPELPGFAEGEWWVQDISSSLPARLLPAGAGRRALDLCAAPGGKTMQLAAAGWRVTALDLSASRLARLSENLERTGLKADLVEGDVMAFAPDEPFDAVLLDAPCSATGIFRRHPDVLHRVRDRAVANLAETQGRMLDHAAGLVAPGGVLVYSVCSLEPAEGEGVADAFAADRRFVREPATAGELPDGVAPGGAGRVRVLPGTLAEAGGADGFFVARFRRVG
ncbi:MAG: Fmu (Sun) protein [Sphingomonas bacterium]|nr:Fmu (Sun) protein [Sphingomonas bacterium]